MGRGVTAAALAAARRLPRLAAGVEERFRLPAERRARLEEAASRAAFTLRSLGESEQGRSVEALLAGRGPHGVVLLSGAHADEPVGAETLTRLATSLAGDPALAPLLEAFRFAIVPHLNPDGEARNRAWMERWPDPEAYLGGVVREPPGRDVEFGYPEMRPENRLVAGMMREMAPIALHMSLHGMGAAEGVQLLIERAWVQRTERLRERFAAAAADFGLPPHDHDRGGEKGFLYLGPGFATTPEGAAMRAHFQSLGDPETAALFHLSSMEYARLLGGDPLCLVTEVPLFLLDGSRFGSRPGSPEAYLALRRETSALRARLGSGESVRNRLAEYGVRPVPLATAVRLQLLALNLGLETLLLAGG